MPLNLTSLIVKIKVGEFQTSRDLRDLKWEKKKNNKNNKIK